MKVSLITLFLILCYISNAQKLDLIVTSDGTSIACRIDSITKTEIYFQMKSHGGNWAQTKDKLDNIIIYKYDFIDRRNYTFKAGTSIIARDANQNLHSFNRNAVYISAGTLGLYFSASGFYERIISREESNTLNAKAFTRLGIGRYISWGDQGTFILPHFGVLTGANNSHIEVAAGIYITRRDSDISLDLPLSGVIAYRYQKPGGIFIGRVGIGFPEGAFLSIGICF